MTTQTKESSFSTPQHFWVVDDQRDTSHINLIREQACQQNGGNRACLHQRRIRRTGLPKFHRQVAVQR
eukprot:m.254083 g.254083  ORF g.254083 m.254083 type:complete len:68 (+) comp17677_c0_seq1:3418-3621(+)